MRTMSPVAAPASRPVHSCPVHLRPAPVNHHVTGGANTPSSGSGKCVDETILKLSDHLSQNTGVQDQLATAVQESTSPHLAFCQWMGLEMSKLDNELWTGFSREAFNLVEHYRTIQAHQPVPHPLPPQLAQLPAVQPQQQPLPFVHHLSGPPLVSPPTYHQQLNQPWQPGIDFQQQR